jgi:uncharacterized integral membrane protein (TIGR00698 family)
VGKNTFFVGLVFAASGFISPPFALAAGLLFGFTCVQPYPAGIKRFSKFLLQASVVALGFGMDLSEVIRVGRSGFVYTAIGISAAMLLGLGLGRVMGIHPIASLLITSGTAICGGSAIAAVAPIAEASEEQMAVSLGTVFALNSVALFVFPSLGWMFHLTQTQFGLWSALAIHDTSSVVGATAKYGAVALAVGTTVKLARALWIVPDSFGTAFARKSKARVRWPWFILLFCLAAMANSYLPVFGPAYPVLSKFGKIGLTVTLYLIGTGLSRETLRQVGVKPLVQGLVLWAVVAISSLALILTGWIHL